MAVLALAACNTADTPTPEETEPTGSPKSDTTLRPDSTGSSLAADIEAITGPEAVTLSTKGLPDPPEGFTRTEVTAFAGRAIDIIERGIAPDLSNKKPLRAFRYVFANQYPASMNAAKSATSDVTGRYDWVWAWASLFDQPEEPVAKVLDARWQVDSVPGELANGTAAPRLQVSLAVAVEHFVASSNEEGPPDADDDPGAGAFHPIVVQRTVTVSGFNPLGGPDWWPGVGVQTSLLFGGKCAPINGSILTATQNPKTLAEDLDSLRNYFRRPKMIDVDAASTTSSLGAYVKKYCED